MTEVSLYGIDLTVPFELRTDFHLRPALADAAPVRVEIGPVERTGERVWVSTRPPHTECWRDGDVTSLHWDGASFAITADALCVDADDPAWAFERYHNPVWSLVVAARGGVAFHGFAARTEAGTIAVMGSSGNGKSSLGRELLDRGGLLVTDDVIVYDDKGRVCPGPEFIRVDTDDPSSWDPGGKHRLRVDSVAAADEIDLVVVLSREFVDVTPLTRSTRAIDALLGQIYNPARVHEGQHQRNLAQAAALMASTLIVGLPRHHLPVPDLADLTEHLVRGGVGAQFATTPAEGHT